jgi:cytidyltransferase-like protein
MKTVGVVAEFNPFHNGHEYFLREAKRLANADYLICAMSPDFVQRGEMAVISEKRRAKAALLAGADVVVAMPLHFSTAAAEIFAEG